MKPSSARSMFSRSLGALCASAFVAATACSGDSVTQPNFTTRDSGVTLTADALAQLIAVNALTRDIPVPAGMVRSFTFTKKGGRIELKETGLRIDIPENAIPGTTLTITVTALPGSAVAYDFQPHGTVFLKSLAFRQDLNNTSWDKLGFKGVINGGYFKNTAQIDVLHGTAVLDEIFPVTFNSKEVTFDIKHFSGYMVSGGRQAAASDY
ncbi:MAG: hypothetical protein ABJB74_00040 [Gemmatimonas sp.]